MIVLCDTSVLVPSFFRSHVHHSLTFPLIQKVLDKKISGVIAQHSLAECYTSFTRVPNLPPVTASQARQMIRDNVIGFFKVIALDLDDYEAAIDRVAEKNLPGGAIYDAIIWRAAIKRRVDRLVTWNLRHFQRLSDGELEIVTPDRIK